ncbi:MATE family efflux transporter [Planctomicrobium sp. SH661]|uniref:MATE family efflux transporter n=1 Tax=Planctomicrobium sp. SH661 TaxID=3448124 RepID=UPI003F5B33E7
MPAAATSGDSPNPLITGPLRRTVFLLALPVLGEQLLNFLVGFFDVWLSGHLPGESQTDATAAVGVAAYSGWLATLIFSLVATGTTALISRAWGRGDHAEANRIANRSVVLSLMMGLLFFVLVLPTAGLMVETMGLEGRAAEIGQRFLRLDAIGLVFASVSLVIAAALRGCGDMRTPMWLFAAVNVVNVICSTGLVYGWGPLPELGVDGIVIGTVIARTSGGLLFLACLWRGKKGLTFDTHELRLGGDIIRRILRIGAPAAAEGIVMWIGHVIFLRLIAGLGQTVFAAHIIGIRVEALTYLPAVAWGAAAATMVGQSLGAGKPDRAYEAGNEAALQCTIFGLGITLWFTLGASGIYELMHQDLAVRDVGSFPFQVVGLFQIPLILSIVYCSSLRGAGDTVFPLASAVITTYLVRLPIAYYCAIMMDMGLMGAWMGMNIDMLMRGVLATWWFWRRRWMKIKV